MRSLNPVSKKPVKLGGMPPAPNKMCSCIRVKPRALVWIGPRTVETSEVAAVATGVQAYPVSGVGSAIEPLVEQVKSETPDIGDHLNYFSCAVLDKDSKTLRIATDVLGMGIVFYTIHQGQMVFSSHQTFIRYFLQSECSPDWNGVFKYLLLGYCIGKNSLLEGVKVLDPGCLLVVNDGECNVKEYRPIKDIRIRRDLSLDQACDMIWAQWMEQFKGYLRVAGKPFLGLLSGGWDSRLITSTLANLGAVKATYSSGQHTMTRYGMIEEKAIIKEVAAFLEVKNHYVPLQRNPIGTEYFRWIRILDFCTNWHLWAVKLVNFLPFEKGIYIDGIFLDTVLRAVPHTIRLLDLVPEDVWPYVQRKDVDAVGKILLRYYMEGGSHPGVPVELWKDVLDPEYLEIQCKCFETELLRELSSIENDDFFTVYVLKNESRRGIAYLPKAMFGSKGAVVSPGCNHRLIEKVLSVSLEMRMNGSLQIALLEHSRKGLSDIISTNTEDLKRLKPYIRRTYSGDIGVLGLLFKIIPEKHLKRLYKTFIRTRLAFMLYAVMKTLGITSVIFDDLYIVEEIIKNPPTVFMDLLTPRIREAIGAGKRGELLQYALFLRQILVLDKFFSIQ